MRNILLSLSRGGHQMSAATGGAGTTNSGAGNPTVPSLLIREEPNYGPGGNITRNGLAANQTLTEKKGWPLQTFLYNQS